MVMPVAYQVGMLGKPNGYSNTLAASARKRLTDLGIDPSALSLMAEAEVASRNRKLPFIGVFFGYPDADDTDHPILKDLIEDSVVIVPAVSELSSKLVPKSIGHINFLQLSDTDEKLERLTSLLLENFQLLRPERRLFISYRRIEAQSIAIQLYESLDSAGFDVFLDTRGVPPAVDFQSVLWHRLADSDVIVLLGTPGFRESRWTREELARANATSVQILHLLWPGLAPDATSAFSEFHPLEPAHFSTAQQIGEDARLRSSSIRNVCMQVESLRSRAISARHRYLVDNFCDQARALGKAANVMSSQFISLELDPSKKIAVVPAAGVPNASRYQQIESAIQSSKSSYEKIWLLYDERGILDNWLEHVNWLNRHLPVLAVRVSEATSRIQSEAR